MCSVETVGAAVAVAGVVTGAAGEFETARLEKAEADYARLVAEQNKEILQQDIDVSESQGEEAVRRQVFEVKQLYGRQRAGFASSGFRLDEGSPLDVLASTQRLGSTDVDTVRFDSLLETRAIRLRRLDQVNAAEVAGVRANAISPERRALYAGFAGGSRVATQYYGSRAVGQSYGGSYPHNIGV